MDHEEIIKEIKEAILKYTKTLVLNNFGYSIEERKEIYSIDILVLIGFKLFLFEVKTGTKEKKARKQLEFHKNSFMKSQKISLPIKNIFFTEIKTFWVAYEKDKIINIETNEETTYINFINDPLSFLLKE